MNQKHESQGEPHYYSQRLWKKLDSLQVVSAAIVEAPPGYGKTTAVRDYLETSVPKNTPVYWFTAVDEAPGAAFRRLCRKIDQIDSRAGQRLLHIELPNAATVGEAADALRSIDCSHEAYLVIDNFQFLQEALLPDFFAALVEHGGRGLHIIIITQVLRRDLLARIAGHRVLRITFADLRLDAEDIRRYYSLAGISITPKTAESIKLYTEGWMIAVYLQLCAFRETGTFSDRPGVLALMEFLIWDPLNEEQQTFLLRLSPFEVVTAEQACFLTGCETLPQYAKNALECQFIRYEPAYRRYELHSILSELLISKRGEKGTSFERECLMRAGDLCRGEGRFLEAMGFYWQIKDYERMLTLDFSYMILEEIGSTPFSKLALDMAQNCPAGIKKNHLLSMLRIAWALLTAGMEEHFRGLMKELHVMLDEERGNPCLLGEWTLLSSFLHYPDLKEMTAVLGQAASLFGGTCSQVILPTAPWCFGSYYPLAEFHMVPGEADREADLLEKYIALYSSLTNGHGSGADVLFRAELAHNRGDLENAEILSYKAVYLAENHRQSVVQLGATMLLAGIALNKADMAGWQHAITSMERAASYTMQNTFVVRSLLDIARGVLLFELGKQEDIADWLKDGSFSERTVLNKMIKDALYVHLNYLMLQGEVPRMMGILQAMTPEMRAEATPFSNLLASIMEAVGYVKMGRRGTAAALLEKAMQNVLPDGLILPLVSYSRPLDDLPGELIAEKYPAFLKDYNAVKERFSRGWATLYNGMLPGELPPDLTSREYEVAKLAAAGLHNGEIAVQLAVSERTVKAHLRSIFQKLDIDRRARLAERLK